jgi:hypothetical protein
LKLCLDKVPHLLREQSIGNTDTKSGGEESQKTNPFSTTTLFDSSTSSTKVGVSTDNVSTALVVNHPVVANGNALNKKDGSSILSHTSPIKVKEVKEEEEEGGGGGGGGEESGEMGTTICEAPSPKDMLFTKNISHLSHMTEGLSGAEMVALVRDAALRTIALAQQQQQQQQQQLNNNLVGSSGGGGDGRKLHISAASLVEASEAAVKGKRITPAMLCFYEQFAKHGK